MNNENKNQDKGMNRRNFIATSAAAGAGLMMPKITRAQNSKATSSSDDLNIALIGTGDEGQVLMNACLKLPNIRFKAVCDIWEDWNLKRAYRLLQKYGHDLNQYVDYREMLASEKDLDAVIVATPDFWHHTQTIACLEAGLDVYCEKEMSNKLENAKKMVESARRTGRLLQIGHQRRSNPRYRHCYEKLIKEAQIWGRPTTINAQWNRAVQPDLGWPKKYAIPKDKLKRYGYDNMHQFRNWRWYKGLGGGPIVDLGSHQIDIFNWFLQCQPRAVMASGGTDYYDPETHEWYDNVQALYEYDTPKGKCRAFYQTITTNSNNGYYETFMGDEATLQLSESAARGGVYRENGSHVPSWDKWIEKGYLTAPEQEKPDLSAGVVLDVRETLAPPKHGIPVKFTDPYHQPHLENFFNAVRGREKLNCPGEIGYETAVSVLRVNEAIEAGRWLKFKPDEFVV